MIPLKTIALVGLLVGTAQDQQAGGRVLSFGQVRRTGLEIDDGTTILEAVSRIETTAAADLSAVILVRIEPVPLSVELDLRNMILTGDTRYDLLLKPGDSIWVPERGGQGNAREQPDVQKAMVMVHRLTYDPDPRARARAALAIGALGEAAVWVLPHLEQALGQDPFVVREVVTALGMIGPPAKDAVPALEKLVENRDRQIAARAKVALRQIRGR